MSQTQISHSRFNGQFPCLNASNLLAFMVLVNLFLLLNLDVDVFFCIAVSLKYLVSVCSRVFYSTANGSV